MKVRAIQLILSIIIFLLCIFCIIWSLTSPLSRTNYYDESRPFIPIAPASVAFLSILASAYFIRGHYAFSYRFPSQSAKAHLIVDIIMMLIWVGAAVILGSFMFGFEQYRLYDMPYVKDTIETAANVYIWVSLATFLLSVLQWILFIVTLVWSAKDHRIEKRSMVQLKDIERGEQGQRRFSGGKKGPPTF